MSPEDRRTAGETFGGAFFLLGHDRCFPLVKLKALPYLSDDFSVGSHRRREGSEMGNVRRTRGAFSLLELMVVLSILSILFGMFSGGLQVAGASLQHMTERYSKVITHAAVTGQVPDSYPTAGSH